MTIKRIETQEEKDKRNQKRRETKKRKLESETESEREQKKQKRRESDNSKRKRETEIKKKERKEKRKRAKEEALLNIARNTEELREEPEILNIGRPTEMCGYCGARRFKGESKTKCCNNKEIQFPKYKIHPEIKKFIEENPNFRDNIRLYNQLFSFSSFGADVVKFNTPGPSVFKIHGTTYHMIDSLKHSGEPKFAQIYLYDPKEQAKEREKKFDNIEPEVIEHIGDLLNEINPFAKYIRQNRDKIVDENYTLELRKTKKDLKTYNLPQSDEIALLIPETDVSDRQIVFESKDGKINYINSRDAYYLPLSYVLMFTRGEMGWQEGIKKNVTEKGPKKARNEVTYREFLSYLFQWRDPMGLENFGRLYQQLICDCGSQLILQRLNFIATHQSQIRAELYNQVYDAVSNNDCLAERGRKVIVPSTVKNSPRQLHQMFQDAMAIVRRYGKPSLFITFTCNPKWEEIQRELQPWEKAMDRDDLLTRVFELKKEQLLDDIVKKHVLGKVKAYCYVVEFQKRGLPHMHLLIIFDEESALKNTADYDKVVSSEIPNPETQPKLYEAVKNYMVHGPCGDLNPSCSCMENGVCTKHFPKEFQVETQLNDDGYPSYKRNSGRTFEKEAFIRNSNGKLKKQTFLVDDRYIVPYNAYLLTKYDAHLNIEVCSTVKAVKYLYKYIFKGSDHSMVSINRDEKQQYLDCLYVASSECLYNIYTYHVHGMHPSVFMLTLHLENEQTIFYDETKKYTEENVNRFKKTTLTEYFKINQEFPELNLLYQEVPEKFTWNKDKKTWTRRKTETFAIGRIINVSPRDEEKFYLRLLLTKVRSPKSFQDLLTYKGVVYKTFKEVCKERNLLENDQEYFECMEESSLFSSSRGLRDLFTIILMNCNPSNPTELFDKFWKVMGDEFRNYNEETQKIRVLLELEKILNQNETSLKSFHLPVPEKIDINPLLDEALNKKISSSQVDKLNDDQRRIYHEVMDAVVGNKNLLMMLDGPGGTGKTFLYDTLINELRRLNKIVLPVASTGIAASHIGGKTAHSQFKIPLKTDVTSLCSIKRGTHLAQLLQQTDLIIWDEIGNISRYAVEAVDRTLKDIKCNNLPFGGINIVLGGDFRQLLPIQKHASPSQIIRLCLRYSSLWNLLKHRRLTINMRADKHGGKEWPEYLISVGDGKVQHVEHSKIQMANSKDDLISFVYPNMKNLSSFSTNKILTTTNKVKNELNDEILDRMPGEETVYESIDTLKDSQLITCYPVEFLNSLNPNGFPTHRLCLKTGTPIMVLRNLNSSLCNGTQLIVMQCHPHVLECQHVKTKETFLIPRIGLYSDEDELPFSFKRVQFPVTVNFCMTVHKSQGSTYQKVALYLEKPIFTHGQMYVALSRTTKFENLKIYSSDKSMNNFNNVVYQEVLDTNLIKDDSTIGKESLNMNSLTVVPVQNNASEQVSYQQIIKRNDIEIDICDEYDQKLEMIDSTTENFNEELILNHYSSRDPWIDRNFIQDTFTEKSYEHFTIIDDFPDGNCFYYAILHILDNLDALLTEKYRNASDPVMSLKQNLLQYLRENVESKFTNFGNWVSEAINNLNTPRQWTPACMILLVAYFFNINVICLHPTEPYQGGFVEVNQDVEKTVFISWKNNNHFVALVPKNEVPISQLFGNLKQKYPTFRVLLRQ
jgi:hypothetical protein